MNWSTTLPTTPGYYLWKLFEKDIGNPCWVTTDGESFWREGKYPATNGFWCRLVPAEEIARAYIEGMEDYAAESDLSTWNSSRAKQIAEGTI